MKIYNSIGWTCKFIHVYNFPDEVCNYGYHYNIKPESCCVAIFKIKYK